MKRTWRERWRVRAWPLAAVLWLGCESSDTSPTPPGTPAEDEGAESRNVGGSSGTDGSGGRPTCSFNVAASDDDVYTTLGTLSETHEKLEQALRAAAPIVLTWNDDAHSTTQLSIEVVRWVGARTDGLPYGCLQLTGQFHVKSADGEFDMVSDGGFTSHPSWDAGVNTLSGLDFNLRIDFDPKTCASMGNWCKRFAPYNYGELQISPQLSYLDVRMNSDPYETRHRAADGSTFALPFVALLDPFGVGLASGSGDASQPAALPEKISVRSTGSSETAVPNDACDNSYVDAFSIDVKSRSLSWDYCATSTPRAPARGSRTLSEPEYQAVLDAKALVKANGRGRACDDASTLDSGDHETSAGRLALACRISLASTASRRASPASARPAFSRRDSGPRRAVQTITRAGSRGCRFRPAGTGSCHLQAFVGHRLTLWQPTRVASRRSRRRQRRLRWEQSTHQRSSLRKCPAPSSRPLTRARSRASPVRGRQRA